MSKQKLKETLDRLGPEVFEVFYYDEQGIELNLKKYTEIEFDNLEVIDVDTVIEENENGNHFYQIVNITVKDIK